MTDRKEIFMSARKCAKRGKDDVARPAPERQSGAVVHHNENDI
ncbi:hypothetical protein [Ferirhizobium litorale]|nr:hypothetical protein [Fererhizobium litorale]